MTATARYIEGLTAPLLNRTKEIELARAIQAARLIRDNKQGEQFSPEQQKILKDGEKARQQMIRSNLRLVAAIARRYNNPCLEFADLFQEGTIGLTTAVDKFDPTKGNKFSTYAYWWIRQSIVKAIHNKGRMVRLPIHVVEKFRKLSNICDELSRRGIPLTINNIAKEAEMTPSKIREILAQQLDVLSLDFPINPEGDLTVASMVMSPSKTNPMDALESLDLKQKVWDALDGLSQIEKDILSAIHGLDGDEPVTLKEASTLFNCSRTRISQRIVQAESRLRRNDVLKTLHL